jgi:phosphoribosylanthranilate isomerase
MTINLTKKIKLCGFTKADTLQVAIDCLVDFVGLVFASDSVRFVSENTACDLAKIIPKTVAKVAVVVDLFLPKLHNIYLAYKPDFWQVHGNFKIADLLLLKNNFPQTKIISAFNISCANDLIKINDFSQISDYFLLDSASSGEGKIFNWQWLSFLTLNKPIILAGGINFNNLSSVFDLADVFDISSGIEETRGIKSAKLIIKTMNVFKDRKLLQL